MRKIQGFTTRFSSQPIINGFRAKLRRQFSTILIGLIVLGVLILLFPLLILPILLPLSAAFLATISITGPLIVGIISIIVALISLLTGCGYCFAFLKPFVRIFSFDPVFGFLLLLCLLCGLGGGSITALPYYFKVATQFYYSSMIFTTQIGLSEFSERLSPRDWDKFQREQCWKLVGFGLPIFLLFQYVHPILVISILQVFQAAAAVLVV